MQPKTTFCPQNPRSSSNSNFPWWYPFPTLNKMIFLILLSKLSLRLGGLMIQTLEDMPSPHEQYKYQVTHKIHYTSHMKCPKFTYEIHYYTHATHIYEIRTSQQGFQIFQRFTLAMSCLHEFIPCFPNLFSWFLSCTLNSSISNPMKNHI